MKTEIKVDGFFKAVNNTTGERVYGKCTEIDNKVNMIYSDSFGLKLDKWTITSKKDVFYRPISKDTPKEAWEKAKVLLTHPTPAACEVIKIMDAAFKEV